jgi:7-carboxy-7-deazaguanine synthase
MKYTVKSVFGATVQGEGGMTGVPCYFVRLAGCNMWDGRPETQAASECPFCDTDFYKGDKMTAFEIVEQIKNLPGRAKWVTLSGGEPALQLAKDDSLIAALHEAGYLIAIETNGTVELPDGFDHVTLSPKQPPENTVVTSCDTLKVLYPHPNPLIRPHAYDHIAAGERYIQPIEPPVSLGEPLHEDLWRSNTTAVLEWLYTEPDWKLSAQVHKYLGVE